MGRFNTFSCRCSSSRIRRRGKAGAAPFLKIGWTLNFEMFFYFVFGLTLWMRDAKRRLAVIAVLFATLVTVGAILQPRNAALGYYTSPFVLEFLMGAVIGYLACNGALPQSAARCCRPGGRDGRRRWRSHLAAARATASPGPSFSAFRQPSSSQPRSFVNNAVGGCDQASLSGSAMPRIRSISPTRSS